MIGQHNAVHAVLMESHVADALGFVAHGYAFLPLNHPLDIKFQDSIPVAFYM